MGRSCRAAFGRKGYVRHARGAGREPVGDERLGTARPAAGGALARSETFWSLAIGDGDALAPAGREQVLKAVPRHLAFGLRGVLSLWTAGEIADGDLATNMRDVALAILLGAMNAGATAHRRTASPRPD